MTHAGTFVTTGRAAFTSRSTRDAGRRPPMPTTGRARRRSATHGRGRTPAGSRPGCMAPRRRSASKRRCHSRATCSQKVARRCTANCPSADRASKRSVEARLRYRVGVGVPTAALRIDKSNWAAYLPQTDQAPTQVGAREFFAPWGRRKFPVSESDGRPTEQRCSRSQVSARAPGLSGDPAGRDAVGQPATSRRQRYGESVRRRCGMPRSVQTMLEMPSAVVIP